MSRFEKTPKPKDSDEPIEAEVVDDNTNKDGIIGSEIKDNEMEELEEVHEEISKDFQVLKTILGDTKSRLANVMRKETSSSSTAMDEKLDEKILELKNAEELVEMLNDNKHLSEKSKRLMATEVYLSAIDSVCKDIPETRSLEDDQTDAGSLEELKEHIRNYQETGNTLLHSMSEKINSGELSEKEREEATELKKKIEMVNRDIEHTNNIVEIISEIPRLSYNDKKRAIGLAYNSLVKRIEKIAR